MFRLSIFVLMAVRAASAHVVNGSPNHEIEIPDPNLRRAIIRHI